MNLNTFLDMCHEARMNKSAAAIMTPEAMQAAVPPPADPNAGMPSQGAPMDPNMMPPQGGAPMDPNAGMPPQGAPMDPNMMPPQGAPMDPGMMAPPSGGMDPLSDPMFLDFLQNGIGCRIDQNSGAVIDPNGQPIDPQTLSMIYQQFQQQLQQVQAQGGMMPPQGAPMDPNAGMPPAGQQPMEPEAPAMDTDAIMNAVQSVIQAQLAAQDKKISALVDKIDSLKSMLQDVISTTDTRAQEKKAQNNNLDSMIQEDLAADQAQDNIPAPTPIYDTMPQKQASKKASRVSMISAMRGSK